MVFDMCKGDYVMRSYAFGSLLSRVFCLCVCTVRFSFHEDMKSTSLGEFDKYEKYLLFLFYWTP